MKKLILVFLSFFVLIFLNSCLFQSNSKEITSFSINGVRGNIFGITINITMPYGTNVESLIANFSSTGDSVTINNVPQISGTTKNNFKNPLEYVVHAKDGTSQKYIVTVRVANSDEKAITLFLIDKSQGIIIGNNINITLPYGVDLESLVATFSTTGVKVEVNGVKQNSGITINNFKESVIHYIVYAADGTKEDYSVIVNNALNDSKDILHFGIGFSGISQIIESNIYVTIASEMPLNNLIAEFATSGKKVTVNNVEQISGETPNDFSNPLKYVVHASNGTIKEYNVIVKNSSDDSKTIYLFSIGGVKANITSVNSLNITGINGLEINATVPYNTKLNNLIADFSSTGSKVTVNGKIQFSGETPNDFTKPVNYVVHAADNSTQTYTVNINQALNHAKEITLFEIDGVKADIIGNSINMTLPYGTKLNHLIPEFNSTGDYVEVNGIKQTSRITANDFTKPIVYTVHAADGTTESYTIKIVNALLNTKKITSFTISNFQADIIDNNITVTLPYNTKLDNLISVFNTTGDYVEVNGIKQISKITANNFTNPLTYIVHAEDGTTESYTVKVVNALVKDKKITSFAINGFIGNIIDNNITVTLPYNTRLDNLISNFKIIGDHVEINGKKQISGETVNNFIQPVTYTVYDSDGSIQNYIVKVFLDSNIKEMISFSIDNFVGNIIGNNINVIIPNNIEVDNSIANFSTVGTYVEVNGKKQISGETINDFTYPIEYIVYAANGTKKVYIVKVIKENNAKEIKSFEINGMKANIIDNKITLIVPHNTRLDNLVAKFSIAGSHVEVNGKPQISEETINDFTSPVEYIVYAGDGTNKKYTVSLSFDLSAKNIKLFNLNGIIGKINENTIWVTMPIGTKLNNLTANFITTGSRVEVNGKEQQSGKTINDFTSPIQYIVYAADGTQKQYLIHVKINDKHWINPISDEYIDNITHDNKGNLYVLTSNPKIDNSLILYQSAFIEKYSENGTLLWRIASKFNYSPDLNNGYRMINPKKIIFDNNNIYILSEISSPNSSLNGYLIEKYSEDGIYLSHVHELIDNQLLVLDNMNIDNEGNIYVSGYDQGGSKFLNQPKIGTIDSFIVKYDKFGKRIWVKLYGNNNDNTRIKNTIVYKGMIYVLNHVTNDKNYTPVYYLRKYTTSGSLIFNELLSTAYLHKYFGMRLDRNENIYILKYIERGTNNENSTYFIDKMNKFGEKLWTKTLLDIKIKSLSILDFNVDLMNNINIVGFITGSYFNPSSDNQDYFIAKYTDNLDFMWGKQIGSNEGRIYANKIILDNLGNTFIAGGSNINLPGYPPYGKETKFIEKY